MQEVVFGWLLIILAAMPLIQICADLGRKFPCSGGLFHYSREAAGEWGGYAVTALVCGSFILGEILLSYWKTEKGSRSRVYSGLSLLSLSSLVSGFTWKILYSVALTEIGYYCFLGKTSKQKERGEKTRLYNLFRPVNRIFKS